MSGLPNVSVILPLYNCEKYISRCLDSILEQTLSNIEIIIVDDGSTDSSLAICKKYAQKCSNIVLISQENSGAAIARITGLKAARGKFIGFVDADDWVDSRMFETLYSEAQRLNADIIQCGFLKTKTDHSKISFKFNLSETLCVSSKEALFQLWGIHQPARFNYLLWNKIYRKNIFEEIELPTYHKANNDVPIIPRVFYGAKRIAVTEQPFVFYFSRNDEINKSISDIQDSSLNKKIYSHILAFCDVSNYYRERNQELYLASLRHTVSWSLSALIHKNISSDCKALAKATIKSAKIWGNPFIPQRKKIVALLIQWLCQ